VIAELGRVLRLFRAVEITGGGRTSKPAPPVMCGCGRTIRVSKKVLAEAPILCGGCGGEFTVQDPDTDDHDADDESGWRGDEPDDEDGSGRRRERAGRRGPGRGALPGRAGGMVRAARLPPLRPHRGSGGDQPQRRRRL